MPGCTPRALMWGMIGYGCVARVAHTHMIAQAHSQRQTHDQAGLRQSRLHEHPIACSTTRPRLCQTPSAATAPTRSTRTTTSGARTTNRTTWTRGWWTKSKCLQAFIDTAESILLPVFPRVGIAHASTCDSVFVHASDKTTTTFRATTAHLTPGTQS